MAGVVDKLVGGEIVVQVVGSQEQGVLPKRMAVERVDHMLTVAVVVVVGTGTIGHEVGLVILVVGIRQLEITPRLPGVLALQSGAVGIEMVVVGIALTGTEEIATTPDERQMVCSAPRESLLDIIGFLSVETAQVGVVVEHTLIVRQTLCLLHQLDGNLL